MNAACSALMDILRQRRSCRNFAPDPLEEHTLATLHQAFMLAPQAGGGRNLHCQFITEASRIQQLAAQGKEAFATYCKALPSEFIREEMVQYGENFFWFSSVPVLASISARRAPPFLQEASGPKAPLLWGGEQSAAMGAFSLLLAAQSLGLGACCLSGPLAVWETMEALLEIPRRNSLVLLIALGKKG